MEQVMTMNSVKAKQGKAGQEEKERRRYPRNNLKLGVQGNTTLEESSAPPLEFHGYTTDVSLRGLCITTDRNLAICMGQHFNVMIQLFQNEPPIEMVGQLCWLKETNLVREEQSTQFGLELLGVVNHSRGYDRWIERINWN